MIAKHQRISTRPLPRAKQRPCDRQIFTSFPNQYFEIRSIHGSGLLFRSIGPEDEPLLLEFHKTLSDQSVHFRYFGAVTLRERTLHERLLDPDSIAVPRRLSSRFN